MIQWIFFDLLKLIGDFERIADHGKNILESARELNDKGLSFSEPAGRELGVLSAAVSEILALSLSAFRNDDLLRKEIRPFLTIVPPSSPFAAAAGDIFFFSPATPYMTQYSHTFSLE